MENIDSRLTEYYITGQYKGYYPVDNPSDSQLPGQNKVAFSNGKIEVFATGAYREEAIAKIFRQIDKIAGSAPSETAHNPSTSDFRLLAEAVK